MKARGVIGCLLGALVLAAQSVPGEVLPDIQTVPIDLETPAMGKGPAAPGKRVKMTIRGFENTGLYAALYLPTDWKTGRKYPVIVEYPGNGPYKNRFGDTCSGFVEDCNLGYGLSGGKGVIWLCLPFVSKDRKQNQRQWWGEVDATVACCKAAVAAVCSENGGDPKSVFLAGFSRGSIACNFIGLHDDEIAGLWRGFICHSHYDGVKRWGYEGSDRASAALRLKRLKNRPQWISHEGSVQETKRYLAEIAPDGKFTFQTLPFRNHTDSWVLRDTAERRAVRTWFREVLGEE